jgi:hypothetical protein
MIVCAPDPISEKHLTVISATESLKTSVSSDKRAEIN